MRSLELSWRAERLDTVYSVPVVTNESLVAEGCVNAGRPVRKLTVQSVPKCCASSLTYPSTAEAAGLEPTVPRPSMSPVGRGDR